MEEFCRLAAVQLSLQSYPSDCNLIGPQACLQAVLPLCSVIYLSTLQKNNRLTSPSHSIPCLTPIRFGIDVCCMLTYVISV